MNSERPNTADQVGHRSGLQRFGSALIGIVGVATLARLFVVFSDVGFVGWDTYPLIEMSRLETWTDFRDILANSLMGKAEGGLYYRPLLKLTLSLDHALWGLWAPGYLLGSIVWMGLLATALYRLTQVLLGTNASWGGAAAVLLLLFHPLQATVLPVVSRRADVLAAAFMIMCVTSMIHAVRGRRARFDAIAAAGFGCLALASKETAFILPPMAWIAGFLYAPGNTALARARTSAICVAPLAAVTLGMLVVRFVVLGGFVGERPILDGDVMAAISDMSLRIAQWMLSGSAIVGDNDPTPFLLVAALAAGIVAVRVANATGRAAARDAWTRPTILTVAWLALVTSTYAVGLILQPWYVVNPLIALTLCVGASVEALLVLVRSSYSARIAAAVALAGLTAFFIALATHSPAVRSYDDWARMTETSEAYLEELEVAVSSATPGSIVTMRGAPHSPKKRRDQPRLVGVTGIVVYSVRAWAMLVFPDLSVRVLPAHAGAEPRSDEVLVLIGRDKAPTGAGVRANNPARAGAR